jgi:hypothetical protein
MTLPVWLASVACQGRNALRQGYTPACSTPWSGAMVDNPRQDPQSGAIYAWQELVHADDRVPMRLLPPYQSSCL